eukprot:1321993-Alexandrium_andersonii.AAC.1
MIARGSRRLGAGGGTRASPYCTACYVRPACNQTRKAAGCRLQRTDGGRRWRRRQNLDGRKRRGLRQ